MPQGFNIGPITIRFYAILILIGALLGTWVAAQLARRKGKDLEVIWDVLPWLLISGIIGARLWHVLRLQLRTLLPASLLNTTLPMARSGFCRYGMAG